MPKNSSLISGKLVTSRVASVVMKCVREQAPISRARLADFCGISRPVITRTVTSLLAKGFLIETPLSDVNGSRRSDGLNLNPAVGYCLSVSYGPDGVNACMMDTSYDILMEENIETDLKLLKTQDKISRIVECVESIRAQTTKRRGECFVLAVVDPGIVDKNAGVAIESTTLRNWRNVPIAQLLEKQFGLPVILINGSFACIRAIDRLELGGAKDDLVYIQYGEGIGCCMKLGGHYITGHSMLAGEFGHCQVTDKEIHCRCGGIGCLEAVAALPALARSVREAIAGGSESILEEHDGFNGNDVLLAAASGDRLAFRIVCEAFECLGQAVGGLVNTLAPEIVVFEEVVGRGGQDAVNVLFQSVKQHSLPSHSRQLDLRISTVASSLGRIACLGGAAAALDSLLDS